jgi:hypothetical protein
LTSRFSSTLLSNNAVVVNKDRATPRLGFFKPRREQPGYSRADDAKKAAKARTSNRGRQLRLAGTRGRLAASSNSVLSMEGRLDCRNINRNSMNTVELGLPGG